MKSFLLFFCVIAYVSAEKFQCQQNVPYIENECNNCVCGLDNQLGCTFKGCFDEAHRALTNCKNFDEEWTKGCNKCWCVEKIGTVCTNNPCVL